MDKTGYIYILTNKHNRVLYVGVTSNLENRILEHKSKSVAGFTKKYNCTRLVYYEECGGIEVAIEREKQLKAGSRKRKITLIRETNPLWKDLSEEIGIGSDEIASSLRSSQ